MNSYDDFPRPGTPEWGEMNKRRLELIRIKVRGQLTACQNVELTYLQNGSLETRRRAESEKN